MKQSLSHTDLLLSAGAMGQRIAKMNWDHHPLGPIDSWPFSLRSALSICLHSKFPVCIYWSSEMYMLYNDAWSDIPGDKHPAALGERACDVWQDIWELIEPDMRNVLEAGEGKLFKERLLPMQRRGFIEEAYFDYTFSPILGDDGKIAGIFNVGNEVTDRIIGVRREATLRQLSEKPLTAESPEAAAIMAANTLSDAPADIPFSLIYLLSNDGGSLRLAASSQVDPDAAIGPQTVDLTATNALPFTDVINNQRSYHVTNLDKHYDLPGGVWPESTHQAVLLPVIRPRSKQILGVLVSGISPRLTYSEAYKNFHEQVCHSVATSINNAYELRHKLNLESSEQRAKEQLKTALSIGFVGIWMWDIKKNILTADHNLARRFGVLDSDAQRGLPLSVFTDSIHPDDRDWVLKAIQTSVDTTKTFQAEYRTIGLDGGTRWVMARGRVEDDEDGNPVRFPGVMVDVTDRKEVEQELASRERIFNALFESTILGIAVATFDGQIHEANETFLTMFGYSENDIKQGLYSHMITPSKSSGVTSRMYKELRDKGEIEPTEKEYIHKDGQTVPVLVGAVTIPGASDRFIAFMLDISKQRRLQALNKAKDEFISIASHQLRTPATGVKQYLGMLLEGYMGALNDEQRKVLSTAYQSNERQLVIVNDLLKVAQADAEGVMLAIEQVNVVSIVKDVVEEQKRRFEASGQTLICESTTKTAIASVDPYHIRMVFENIIDNAHKYTPEGKAVTVTIRKDPGAVTISIKDQGIGIYQKDMPKLFKKFSRIENPLSTRAGGTGLGLYWVHKIIDLHHGKITVSSRYKHGTEFVITLPADITKV